VDLLSPSFDELVKNSDEVVSDSKFAREGSRLMHVLATTTQMGCDAERALQRYLSAIDLKLHFIGQTAGCWTPSRCVGQWPNLGLGASGGGSSLSFRYGKNF